jgi:hypothetical protein
MLQSTDLSDMVGRNPPDSALGQTANLSPSAGSGGVIVTEHAVIFGQLDRTPPSSCRLPRILIFEEGESRRHLSPPVFMRSESEVLRRSTLESGIQTVHRSMHFKRGGG